MSYFTQYYQIVDKITLKIKLINFINKCLGVCYPIKYITEDYYETRMKELNAEIDRIEEWFKNYGDYASNLKFLQTDAYEDRLIREKRSLEFAYENKNFMPFV